ncbi:zinc ABC transporter substrate-binding protein ZnuA [Vibrio sp. ZSDE26]|uniref:High-affinity zinc uptake system protein ZnuA n=1 Tax=Vibrio amylolyticus TaxID=2847292 RepID=A0A9X1XJ93_9VIBR|nr:zinc ABC transporter substrate-binding protein ZnuA [Vibrio amylolyticus]MCK6262663.1 zinc ABC transporter substrate-binding protein ZnuA [Vibrio amylolyticus]
MKSRLAIALALIVTASPTWAVNVLSSIKPIQMITTEIMLNVGEPDVLLANNTSPHDYAMRPSDIRRIRGADLVIWFGYDLEPFLDRVLAQQDNVLTLSSIPQLALREYSGDQHQHDGHDHGDHDPHFWLGVEPSLQVAEAIAEKLSKVDPEYKQQYQSNYDNFKQRLLDEQKQLTAKLEPVRKYGYYVFHDAYGYFESDYQMNHLGYFTVTPDRKPGAKTLIAIKTTLKEKQAKCVFSEPQFTPAVVESVTRGTNVHLGELDPIGIDIEVKAGSYFVFLNSMADNFIRCLAD